MTLTRNIFILAAAMTMMPLAALAGKGKQQSEELREVSFAKVHFDDAFWAPRIEINRTVSIPSAFRECERNGRFDNFALAAGMIKGEHKGDFSFDDTDPYKVIEGASYALAARYDRQLDHYLDSVIAIIAAAQEPDGYLTTCVTNKCYRLSGWWGRSKWEKINSHELYNSGHLIESAVAHYKATGKRTFLDVAIRNADLVCKTFGPAEGQIHRPGGHPIIEMALCKLYKVTGNKRYLDGARYFVEETGRCTDGHAPSAYSQDHMPILQQEEIVGHAVRAGYLFSGVADVAALTQDTAYFNALQRIWLNMSTKKLYITGGIGSRAQGEGFGPNYELNNMQNYCETCAAIANVYWNHRMFLATGDARYANIVERALYNGVISGVSLSGDRFFYDNPLESMGQHERQPWFGCACCPGNVTRFIASVPGYAYATRARDIYINLYVQGTADIATDKGVFRLRQTTEYPWDGHIRIDVEKAAGGSASFCLRMPAWLSQQPVAGDLYAYADHRTKPVRCRVNGEEIHAAANDKGYLVINRTWRRGDVVELDLPMDVRRIQANDNVVDDRGKRCLERGPIVYCIEGQDQADSTVFDKYIRADAPIEVLREPQTLGGIVALRGTAGQLLPDGRTREVPFRAIPYSTWQNRGADQMAVWIPLSPQYAHATPAPTIASRARTLTIQAPIQKDAPESAAVTGWAWGVNDQWEPRCSSDISKPYHYWWLKNGTLETLVYEFERPTTVHNVQVYWLDFDHYDGNFRTPASWELFYRDGEQWKKVDALSPYTVDRDRYNSVDFIPVTTTALKMAAQLRKGESGGVIEWKVN